MKALEGIRVLDLSRLYPGPLATHLLAQRGAEVIKIEDPSQPDYIGRFPPFVDGQSVNDLALNRLKQKMFLPFIKNPEEIKDEIQRADVLLESFRPGTMKDWGLGQKVLMEWNPSLIGVSLSAFGSSHPWSKNPGHDLNILALSGGLFLNSGTENQPTIPANQWVDVAAANEVVSKVLEAILLRTKTLKGCWLDISMLESVKSYFHLQWTQAQIEPMFLNMLNGTLPCYNVYPTKDKRWVALGALEHKFWQRFCQSIQKPEWESKGLDPGPQGIALKEEIAESFRQKEMQEWADWEETHGPMCLSPVLTPQEALIHFKMDDYLGLQFP